MTKTIQIVFLFLTISASLALTHTSSHTQSDLNTPQLAPIYDPSSNFVLPAINTNINPNSNIDYVLPTSVDTSFTRPKANEFANNSSTTNNNNLNNIPSKI